MLATPACSPNSLIQTRGGMTVEISSRTFTGPVRPFFKVSSTFSLSSSAFFSWVMFFTSPMVFSSVVIWARVESICRFTWVSRSSTWRYQRKLPIKAPTTTSAKRTSSCWPNSRFFLARTGRRLIRIIAASSLLVRATQGEPDRHRGRRGYVHDVVGIEAAVVDLDPLEGVEDLDRDPDALLDDLEEGRDLRRAAGEVEAGDVRICGGRRVEVEAALDFARHLVGDALDDPLHFLRDHRIGILGLVAAYLQLLRLVVRDVELLLDLLGELVPAHGDVAGEGGETVRQHVDVHHRGAGVDEDHRLAAREVVVDLEGVLHREGVDVDDHGNEPRLRDHRGVVVDHVLLGGDEEDVHLPRSGVLLGGGEDLDVDVHVLDVEGDVLLRLPLDALLELVAGHAGHGDLLDDHAVARDPDGHLAVLQLELADQLPDPLDDGGRVHQGAVDDGLGRQRRDAEGVERVAAFAGFLQLNELHGRRADVEAERELALRHC